MNLVLTALLIGNMTITAYRSIPRQTDASPWITSIGERVHPHGVAVSRDLLVQNGGTLNYGDLVYVEGFGFKVVNDCMHKRHKQAIDIWVATYKEEKAIRFKRGSVWLVKTKMEEPLCQRVMKMFASFVRCAKEILGTLKRMIF